MSAQTSAWRSAVKLNMMRLFINVWLEIKIVECHVRPDFCLEVSCKA